jgi:hypothetical protein
MTIGLSLIKQDINHLSPEGGKSLSATEYRYIWKDPRNARARQADG